MWQKYCFSVAESDVFCPDRHKLKATVPVPGTSIILLKVIFVKFDPKGIITYLPQSYTRYLRCQASLSTDPGSGFGFQDPRHIGCDFDSIEFIFSLIVRVPVPCTGMARIKERVGGFKGILVNPNAGYRHT
jgi:hypothetical protein